MKKRILTAMLAGLMLVGVATNTAFAKEITYKGTVSEADSAALIDSNSYKIKSDLQEKLAGLKDDEQISVWVYFKAISMEQIRKDAAAECGIEEGTPLYLMLVNPSDMTQEDCEIVNEFSYSLTDMEEEQQKEIYDKQKEYRSVYRQMAGNIGRTTNEKYLEECGITDEQIIFKSSLTPSAIVNLSKDSVYDLSCYDFVTSIYLYEPEEGAEPTNSKLTSELIEEMNNTQSDSVSVYIWLEPCTSEAEIEKLVNEKYTWSDADEYLMYYRKEVANIIGAYVNQFVDDNSELIDSIIFKGDSADFIIAEVSKENVYKLADIDIVQEISLYVDEILDNEEEKLCALLKPLDSTLILGRPSTYVESYGTALDNAKKVRDNAGSSSEEYKQAKDALLQKIKDFDVYTEYAKETYEKALAEQNYNGWYTDEEWSQYQACIEALGKALKDNEGSFTSKDVTKAYQALIYTYNMMTNAYTVKGDLDKNGKFDINDITLLQRYLSEEVNLTGAQKMLTNAKNYESPDINTVTTLQKISVGMDSFKNNSIFISEKPDTDCWDVDFQYKTYCNFNICSRNRPYIPNDFNDFDVLKNYYKSFPEDQ